MHTRTLVHLSRPERDRCTRVALRLLVLVLAVALFVGCGDDDEGDDQSAGTTSGDGTTTTADATTTTAGDDDSGGSTTVSCPSDADISAIIGTPVTSQNPAGTDCFYTDESFSASVTIVRFAASSADQLLSEMEDSAEPTGATVDTIDIGDGGYAYGAFAYSQGFATAGESTYLVDVEGYESGNPVDALVQVLELVLAENS